MSKLFPALVFCFCLHGLTITHAEVDKPTDTSPCPDDAKQYGTFRDLINEIIDLRERSILPDNINTKFANLIELPKNQERRGVEVNPSHVTDSLDHFCIVFLDRSNDKLRPVAVILYTDLNILKLGGEEYFFKLSPEGVFQKAIVIRGPNDAQNKPIAGAGTATTLDINDAEVRYRLDHEMDFWLKRMYRRKKTAQSKDAK